MRADRLWPWKPGRSCATAGVHLNDPVGTGAKIQGKLNVTFPDNAQAADDLQRNAAKLMVLFVSQRLAGSDDDTLSGMNSKRIDVLHVAHGNTVVVLIAHDFVFELFPTRQVFLNQNLCRMGEGFADKEQQLRFIATSTGTRDRQGKKPVRTMTGKPSSRATARPRSRSWPIVHGVWRRQVGASARRTGGDLP